MRKVILVLIIITFTASLYGSMRIVEPASAANVGTHQITALYYGSHIYDIHETMDDQDIPPAEWQFELSTEGKTTIVRSTTVSNPGYIDLHFAIDIFSGKLMYRTLTWDISGDTSFNVTAKETDLILEVEFLDYESVAKTNVPFSEASPVNTEVSQSRRVGDVTHYFNYTIANSAPTAHIAATSSPIIGQPASFDGSGSDPEGDLITGYEWNFGDDETSTLQNPTHTYDTPGTYTVTLSVHDVFGEYSTTADTVTVTVTPIPEYPPMLVLPLLLIFTILAAIITKAKCARATQRATQTHVQ